MKAGQLKYYQHRYGGIYQVIVPKVTSSVDKSIWVVYSHVYPFETEVWCRPSEEFTDGRFKEISEAELKTLLTKDKFDFQKEIDQNRKLSKPKTKMKETAMWPFPTADDKR
jgi:hypothetical protein